MIVKIMGRNHRIGFLPLCLTDGIWIPIGDPGELLPDFVAAAKVCARHVQNSITYARNAAERALERCEHGQEARLYIELTCEHLDAANENVSRLLDEPTPEDVLDERIEPAEPTQSAAELFLMRLLALPHEVRRETGGTVEAWALELAAKALRQLARNAQTPHESQPVSEPTQEDDEPETGGSA